MDGLFQAGRRRSRAVVAVMAIMLLAGEGRAKAGQITTTSGFTDYSIGQLVEVGVSAFDPRMGTLIGATVSLESTYMSNWRFYKHGTGPENIPYGVNIFVHGPILLVSGEFVQWQSFPSSGTTPFAPPIGIYASQTISGNDLNGFIGTPYNVVDYFIELSLLYILDSEGSGAIPNGGPWIGSISITYTYVTGSSIPEPSGLALGGIALVVLAGWGCLAKPRRRADQNPAN